MALKDTKNTAPATDELDDTSLPTEEVDAPAEIRTKGLSFSDVFDFFEMLIIAACAILLLFTFVARLSVVDGDSMKNTLEHGDRILVSNLFYTPQQGDIIVFQDLESGMDTAVIKRVIATGGQTVKLTYDKVGGVYRVKVEIDGAVLDESAYRFYDLTLPEGMRYIYHNETYTVPEGHVFVMGDNTYNSDDSRGTFGYIANEKILGRVVFRLMGNDFSDFFSKFGAVA